jgi:hypothetical protein
MAVYVDDMRAQFGRMIMCHMLADTDEELHAMADKIGVARRWHQKAGTHLSHYDICLSKRAIAVQFGAKEIVRADVARLIKAKRALLSQSVSGSSEPQDHFRDATKMIPEQDKP